MKRSAIVVAIWIGMMALAAPQAFATAIVINNPGFDANVVFTNTCCAVTQFWTSSAVAGATAIPGWTVTNSTVNATPNGGDAGVWLPAYNSSVQQAFIQQLPGSRYVAYSNGGSISQTLSTMAQQAMVYTLTVAVGRRFEAWYTPLVAVQNYTISLYAGTDLLGQYTGNTITQSPNSWTTVTLTAMSNSSSGPLRIVLQAAGNQVDFDNLWLDGTYMVPEPAFGGLVGGSLLIFGWFARRRRKTVQHS